MLFIFSQADAILSVQEVMRVAFMFTYKALKFFFKIPVSALCYGPPQNSNHTSQPSKTFYRNSSAIFGDKSKNTSSFAEVDLVKELANNLKTVWRCSQIQPHARKNSVFGNSCSIGGSNIIVGATKNKYSSM